MSKNKNNNCYPNYNKDGEIISYRFFFSGKDFYTGKPKQYTKTWKIPIGLNNKEIEFERKKFEYEFYKECEKKSLGTFIQDCNITFEEFSKQWLERILKRNEESFSTLSFIPFLPQLWQWSAKPLAVACHSLGSTLPRL
jgi:hypothetical protein